MDEKIVATVDAAFTNVDELFIVRRKMDKTGFEVVHNLDFDMVSDDTLKVVFEGTSGECEDEAHRLRVEFLARAAIEAYEAAIAEAGFVIVPRETTQAMYEAAENEFGDTYSGGHTINPDDVWDAMLAAAGVSAEASAPSAPPPRPPR